jgi:simple sugar transport system permease protein
MKRNAFIALSTGFLVAICIIFINSKNPIKTTIDFFTGPFSSPYYFGTWLNNTTLLATAALGIFISTLGGNMNLGGEGQIYVGGFITAFLFLKLPSMPLFLSLGITLISCLVITGLMSAISGFLKVYRGINEILSSFLLSLAVIPLIDYTVSGPLRDSSKNLLAMPFINNEHRFLRILSPSPLNISIFVFIIFFVLCLLFLYKTKIGRTYRLSGIAPEFAFYSGYSLGKSTILGLTVSGMFHGLTGFFAVSGTYYTCHTGFYSGMGWNALSIALITQSNPLFILPSALLVSFLITASDKVILSSSMNFDMTNLIQGAIFLVISAQFITREKKRKSQ